MLVGTGSRREIAGCAKLGDYTRRGSHAFTNGPHLIQRAGAPDRRQFDHAPVSLATRTGQLVLGNRRDDDAGADRVDSRAAPDIDARLLRFDEKRGQVRSGSAKSVIGAALCAAVR